MVASTREETAAIRDQLTQFRLIDQYKRAGLTETEAAIRAEEAFSGIEARRARIAAESAAAQAAKTEKQIAASTGKTASALTAFAPVLVGGITVHEISALNDEYISRALQDQLRAAQTAPITGADIPGGAPSTSGISPKNAARITKLQSEAADFEKLKANASGRELATINKAIDKREKQIGFLEQGVSAAAATAASAGGGTGRRGPSAETLARREKAARLKGIRDDRAFDSALRQAQSDYLSEQGRITNDAAAQAQVERDRVTFQRDQFAKEIAAKGPGKDGTGQYSGPEVEQLQLINARTAAVRLAAIDQAERRRNADDIRSLDRAELEARRESLQSRGQEATTLDERRRVARQILDIDYEIKAAELRALAADPTRSDAERGIAGDKLRALPGQKAADQQISDTQNEGPLARFRHSYDDPKTQIEQAVADKLRSVDDAITNAAAKALGIKDPFLRSLLQTFLEQNVLRPLYDSLQGAQGSGGGIGGFLSSAVKAVGSVFGHRATGGPVVPGASYLVGERGPEVVQFAGAGNVYPNGRLPNVSSGGGGTTVVQHISVDGRNSVTPDGFARQILGIANDHANRAASAAGQGAVEASPGRIQRKQTLGT